ncbi:MAG TPA: hypothetical protein VFQ02_09780 [Nitrospira sp.]|nr:hypothetical protein [Nitrospira sp.]
MPRKVEQLTPARLETQIHRRKKAKAFSPLLPEWEKQNGTAPAHLRMDAALMRSSTPRTRHE